MKNRNNCILVLVFVVLFTMFININSVKAAPKKGNKKSNKSESSLKCTYKVTDSNYKIVPTVDAKNKTISLTARDNCLFYLKHSTDSKKFDKCDKKDNKKRTFKYEYDPDCMNLDPNYSFLPVNINGTIYYNADACPKQLCAKANEANEDKDATKGFNNLCWYDVNGNKNFNMILPKNKDKVIKFTVAASASCELELGSDATDKDREICSKKEGDFVTYYYDPTCKENGFKKFNSVEGGTGSAKGCPQQLCLKKADAVRPLIFANSKGCALWGSLLGIFKMLLTVVKWFFGVGLIILTMLDFAKTVMSSDPEQDLAKTKKKLTTRIIIIIIIFLAPAVLDVLINNVLDVKTCINKL